MTNRNAKVTTDDYEDFVDKVYEGVDDKGDLRYRDAYFDGAYDFFAHLLGEPGA